MGSLLSQRQCSDSPFVGLGRELESALILKAAGHRCRRGSDSTEIHQIQIGIEIFSSWRDTAHFRRHEIPESGIGNPGLPFLVSFVLRNSKTNLKRFRIPDSRSPIPDSGILCLRKLAVLWLGFRTWSEKSGVNLESGTCDSRRHPS